MTKEKRTDHFVKVLFPFQYDNSVKISNLEEKTIYTAKGNAHKIFQKIGFENVDLRKGLSDLFAKEDNKSKIMVAYRVEKNIRRYLDLPKREVEVIDFFCRSKEHKAPYKVKISDICLYLFESGVGFVELECTYECENLIELIDCNYFLSEIGDENNYFEVTHEMWNSETNTKDILKKRFPLVQLLGRVLENVPGVVDFYSGLPWERVYKKGIIYSYILLDEKPKYFDEILFNLCLNYKESYKAPKKYMTMQENPAILQQFDNSYWISSYNGAINVSIKTKDDTTNDFFTDDFESKMHKDYFVLYLAVLHQRYVLMKLMYEMGELDRLDLEYMVMKEQLVEARKYQAEAANLKFRDFFKFPSYVQHVNDYYKLLTKTLSIDELYNDLSQDLSNIEEICKVYVEKINQHEEIVKKIRKAVAKTITTMLGAVIGVVTLLNESWDVLEVTCGIPSGTFSLPVLLVTAILGVPSALGVVEAVDNVRELRKNRIDMEMETVGLKKNKKYQKRKKGTKKK